VSTTTAARRLAALLGIALTVDFALAAIGTLTRLPLGFDAFGTVLAGALGGPVIGFLAGVLSGAGVGWLVPGAGPVLVASAAHAVVGLAAAVASKAGALRRPGTSLAAGAAAGLAVAAGVLLAGRLTSGAAPLAAFLLRAGRGATAVLVGLGVAAEVVEKSLMFLLVGLLMGRLSRGRRP